MLPASHQPIHDAAVLARQHVEYLDAPVMAQTLSKARICRLLACCMANVNRVIVDTQTVMPILSCTNFAHHP